MADNLTDTSENLLLTFLLTATAVTRPTTPIKMALVTANGSDSAAGTEVSGGSYARQNVTFGAAGAVTAGLIENSAAVTFTSMPAATVVGIELWDSATTPVRLAYGPLSANKTTNSGDTFTVAIGDLDITLA